MKKTFHLNAKYLQKSPNFSDFEAVSGFTNLFSKLLNRLIKQ